MKLRSLLLLLLALLPACATGTAPAVLGDDAPDARVDDPDAPDAAPTAPDAAPPAAVMAASLILTEVVLAPTDLELIEIANPTDGTVDLSRYYLTDVPTYFRVPASGQTVDTADFVARFPAGASIAPGEVIVVALAGAAAFTTASAGVAPDYSIADATMTVVASSGAPTLTNGGELVALFYWDGTTDLVTDVDLLLAGAPSAINGLTTKSAVAVDGPDGDGQMSSYHADANTITAQASTPGSALSTKRVLLESGHEQQGGLGNGVGGDDETSEATTATWDSTYTAATPGATTLAL